MLELFQEIGNVESIKGITEGVENTNYLVNLQNNKKFIFTIFEKRTKSSDLPFFHDSMKEFNLNKINCPIPIIVNEQDLFNVKNKPCAIYSFIEGNQITSLNDQAMISLSTSIAQIHSAGIKSKLRRENDMLLPTWKKILVKFQNYEGKNKNEINLLIIGGSQRAKLFDTVSKLKKEIKTEKVVTKDLL